MKRCYPRSHVTRWSRGNINRLLATKLEQDSGLWWETENSRVTCSFVHVVTRGHVTNKKRYISTYARLCLLNLKWMWLMRRGHHPPWSHDTIVTWRVKKVISLFSHGSWLPNSTRWWLMVLGHHAQSRMNLWSRDYM